MKKSATRRALFMSFASMFLCFTMLLGTTYAWFTDSVESGVNTIVAGNLDIKLDYAKIDETGAVTWDTVQDKTDLFGSAKWEPGHTEVVYLRLTNAGDLALKYSAAVNVIGETTGINVKNEKFALSQYLVYDIIDAKNPDTDDDGIADNAFATRNDAIAAATGADAFSTVDAEGIINYDSQLCFADDMAAGEVEYFAVVIYMPTTVGNEANYMAGTTAPTIDLGIGVFATQLEAESDSFGKDYDKDAELPSSGKGTGTLGNNVSAVEVQVRESGTNAKLATFIFPKDSMAGTEVDVSVEESTYEGNFTVASDMETKVFDITVSGLADNNATPVKGSLRMPTGLDPDTVKLYHYDTEIECIYNPTTGYVIFETTSFSPFTVVYDAESVYVAPEDPKVPFKATVEYKPEYVGVDLPWGSYGAWSPTEGLDSQLEAAFTFTCPTDLADEVRKAYEFWYCDFYVSLDKELGENQIFLGGNYGSFGWVGFHNGELTLAANEEIPLLGSVTSNPWTYSDVESFVGTFTCGVGDVEDALDDATFTVKLRLTNPENETEYYDVNIVTYTFGGDAVIDGVAQSTTNN